MNGQLVCKFTRNGDLQFDRFRFGRRFLAHRCDQLTDSILIVSNSILILPIEFA
jgi:hypothetical protein